MENKEVKYVPILFSTDMVKAILDGRKTQTRRAVKSKHESGLYEVCKNMDGKVTSINSLDWDERSLDNTNDIKPKADVGDIFWVRETWALDYFGKGQYWHFKEGIDISPNDIVYKASSDDLTVTLGNKWKPSIFMPKEACRIFLKVTQVRLERLNDISEKDAIDEGVERTNYKGMDCWKSYTGTNGFGNARDSFFSLWESINGLESLQLNPWVFVYDFEIIERMENWIR